LKQAGRELLARLLRRFSGGLTAEYEAMPAW